MHFFFERVEDDLAVGIGATVERHSDIQRLQHSGHGRRGHRRGQGQREQEGGESVSVHRRGFSGLVNKVNAALTTDRTTAGVRARALTKPGQPRWKRPGRVRYRDGRYGTIFSASPREAPRCRDWTRGRRWWNRPGYPCMRRQTGALSCEW